MNKQKLNEKDFLIHFVFKIQLNKLYGWGMLYMKAWVCTYCGLRILLFPGVSRQGGGEGLRSDKQATSQALNILVVSASSEMDSLQVHTTRLANRYYDYNKIIVYLLAED